MTEKQGGSDVRANTTRAEPLAADGEYALTGHKWFCSAPMCDVFLVLAQAPAGLTCFVVPRVLPDGTRNTFRIQRLKDKLGNRSNASAEIELDRTWARRLGEEGRGVRDHHRDGVDDPARLRPRVDGPDARGRRAGHPPRRAPVGVRLAARRQAADADRAGRPGRRVRGGDGARDAAGRLVRRASDGAVRASGLPPARPSPSASTGSASGHRSLVGEALECLGGNGYVEESGLPRLYREAPLNSIWEGSGNVNALDVLRALAREPATRRRLLRRGLAGVRRRPPPRRGGRPVPQGASTEADEAGARRLVESLALVLQGSLLVRHAPAAVADAFCATRLDGDWGHAFGTLPTGLDPAAIVARATPACPDPFDGLTFGHDTPACRGQRSAPSADDLRPSHGERGIIPGRAGLAPGMTQARRSTTRHECCRRVRPRACPPCQVGWRRRSRCWHRDGRERETNGTLTCMTAFVAFLVERLHVDLGRVSTAVCMAG